MKTSLVLVLVILVSVGAPPVSGQSDPLTGQGVDVGIIDVSFDIDDNKISDQIVSSRDFSGSQDKLDVYGSHGTLVSRVVLQESPQSRLHVAAIGGGRDYIEATEWMIDNNIDVVVISLSFFNSRYDEESILSIETEDMVESGIIVVTSSGNSASRTWWGQYEGDSSHEWAGDDRLLINSGGQKIYVSEYDWDTDGGILNYTLHDPNTDEVLDSALVGDDNNTRVLTAPRANQEYELGVSRVTTGPDPSMIDIRVAGGDIIGPVPPTRRETLQAPALTPGVVTVGALNRTTGQITEYSSRGPVRGSDREGVDITARSAIPVDGFGPFRGTSSSAPFVGAKIAQVQSVEDVSGEISFILRKMGGEKKSTQRGWGEWRQDFVSGDSLEVDVDDRQDEIIVTVNNTGTLPAFKTLDISVGRQDLDSEKILLGSGEKTTIKIPESTLSITGVWELKVGNTIESVVVNSGDIISRKNAKLDYTRQPQDSYLYDILVDRGGTVEIRGLTPGKTYWTYTDQQFVEQVEADESGRVSVNLERGRYLIVEGSESQGTPRSLGDSLVYFIIVISILWFLWWKIRRREPRIEWN